MISNMQVIEDKGYDGALADLWSCGVILFVMLAGFLPFEDDNVASLYKKISGAQFNCPSWFSDGAKKLITRILDPNPSTVSFFTPPPFLTFKITQPKVNKTALMEPKQ
jgi:serine/threonine protein kinase